MHDPKDKPPPFAELLLSWLVADDWQTPIGDFEEYFHEKVQEVGARRARWWYRAQVFRMLPDRLIQKTYWFTIMMSTYLKLAYRNLLKNKVAASINIIGLSIAIGCTIVAYLFVHSKVVRDDFHQHADEIFLIEQIMMENDESYIYGFTPYPLGPTLSTDIPQIKNVVRIKEWRGEVSHEENQFGQNMSFVDESFLDMFTFPTKYGDASALKNRNAIVLSASTAERYFGNENPVGETLTITIQPGIVQTFTVGAVTEPFPANAGLEYSLLVHIDNLPENNNDTSQWLRNVITFVQLNDASDAAGIASQMDAYVEPANAANKNYATQSFLLDNLQDLTYSANDVRNSVVGGIPLAPVIVLSVLSIFLLSLACVNYVNIAISTATRRLKEIGVRKVMGSTKRQLIEQFFAENILVCMIALALGVLIATVFLLPAFNNISNFGLSMFGRQNMNLWGFLLMLLLFIAMVSGIYPAIYVASFKPVTIFRGKQHISKKRRFTYALLTFQFILASITMVGSIAFMRNDAYQQEINWGYDSENVLVVSLQDADTYSLLKNTAQQLPTIVSSSGSRNHIGHSHQYRKANLAGEDIEVIQFAVDPSYAQTMGLRLVSGHFFNPDLVAGEDAIVVNETFVQNHELDNPIGQQIRLDSTYYAIIGIVTDFHYDGFSSTISPVVFKQSKEVENTYLSMQLKPGTATQTINVLESAWAKIASDKPLPFFFQDTIFDDSYREARKVTSMMLFIGFMAQLIACMGLFGLVAQNIAGRMKEIGVRKVLGASIGQIMRLVNQNFIILLVVAALIATPISWLLIDALLGSIYAYYQSMSTGAILIAYILIFATAALTISTQIYKVSVVNPAEVLRDE